MNTKLSATRNLLATALLGVSVVLAAAPLAAASAADVISFNPGSPWSQAVGSGSKDANFHEYTINANAGKTLKINLISRNPNLFFRVLPGDSHKPLVDTGSTGDTSWSTPVATNAAYIVRVYEDPDTVASGDVSKYALQVGMY